MPSLTPHDIVYCFPTLGLNQTIEEYVNEVAFYLAERLEDTTNKGTKATFNKKEFLKEIETNSGIAIEKG